MISDPPRDPQVVIAEAERLLKDITPADRRALIDLVRAEVQARQSLEGIASAHESLTRVIAECVGEGDPSGPYWEDGVRFLKGQAEIAEQARQEVEQQLKDVESRMAQTRDVSAPDATAGKD